MVQVRTIEKLISKAPEIAQEAGTKPEIARKVMEALKERLVSKQRHPREPAPKGSISISAASKKYDIPNQTISHWAKRGYIKILKETPNWKYISEESLRELIKTKKLIAGKKLHGITPAYSNTNMSQ